MRSSRSACELRRGAPPARARPRLAASAASSASRTRLSAPPTSRRPSWSRPPSLDLNDDSGDFLPSSSWSSARSSSRVDAAAIRGTASASMASISERIERGCSPLRRGPRQSVRCGPAVAPLAERLEAQHRAGHRDVERLGAAGHRDGELLVDGGEHRRRQAVGLAAEHDGDRAAEVGVVVGQCRRRPRWPPAGRRGRPAASSTVDRVASARDGHVEQRARRCPHALRVAGVDRAPAEEHRGRAGGLGGPQQRAGVARVGHVDEDQRQRARARPPRRRPSSAHLDPRAIAASPLRRDGVHRAGQDVRP